MTEFITAFISVMTTVGVFATVFGMSHVAIWLYEKWRTYLCRPRAECCCEVCKHHDNESGWCKFWDIDTASWFFCESANRR